MQIPKLGETHALLIIEYAITTVACSPAMYLLWLIMFESREGFCQAIKQSFRAFLLPEASYLFKGDYWEDRIGPLKIFVLGLLSAIGIHLAHDVFFNG